MYVINFMCKNAVLLVLEKDTSGQMLILQCIYMNT